MSLKSIVEKRSLAVIATFCVMVACGGKSEPAATKKAPSSAPASGSSTTSEKTAQKSDAPTPTPPKGSDRKTAPSPTTPAVPGATKAAPAKKALGALRHIPKTALAVAEVRDLNALWERYAKAAVFAVASKDRDFQRGASAIKEASGVDVNRLETLGAFGIDVNGPVGGALLSVAPESFVVYATLSNAEVFVKKVKEIAKTVDATLNFEKVGDAQIATTQAPFAVVVKSDTVYVVSTRASGSSLSALARAVASLEATDSMASLPVLTEALKRTGDSGHFKGWVKLNTLLTMALGPPPTPSPVPPYLTRQLNEAKAAKDQAAIKRTEKLLAEHHAREKRWNARRAAERRMIGRTIGGFDDVAWNVTVTDDAVTGTWYALTNAESTFGKIFKGVDGSAATFRASNASPVFAIHAGFDKNALMQLLAEFARAEGADLAEAKAGLKAAAGVDFDAELLAALGSQAGLAVYLDEKALNAEMASKEPSAARMAKAISAAVAIKLADPAKLKALITKLIVKSNAAELVKHDAATGTWSVDVPMFKTVSLTIADGWLSLSTDADFHGRLVSSKASASPEASPHPAVSKLVATKGAALTFLLDQAAQAWFIMGLAPRPRPRNLPAIKDPSPDLKKLMDEYTALDEELAKEDAKERKSQQERGRDVLSRFGHSAFAVSLSGKSVTVHGGQYFRGGLTEFVKAIVAADSASRARLATWRTRSEKRQRLWDLEQKIQAATKNAPPQGGAAAPSATPKPGSTPKAMPPAAPGTK